MHRVSISTARNRGGDHGDPRDRTGHATRCLDTAFATSFEEERARLVAAGLKAKRCGRNSSDSMGRLRIASKGLTRTAESPALLTVDEAGQREQGLYMIGEVAAFGILKPPSTHSIAKCLLAVERCWTRPHKRLRRRT